MGGSDRTDSGLPRFVRTIVPWWVRTIGRRRARTVQRYLSGPLLFGGITLLVADFFLLELYYSASGTSEPVLSGSLLGRSPLVVTSLVGALSIACIVVGYLLLVSGAVAQGAIDEE